MFPIEISRDPSILFQWERYGYNYFDKSVMSFGISGEGLKTSVYLTRERVFNAMLPILGTGSFILCCKRLLVYLARNKSNYKYLEDFVYDFNYKKRLHQEVESSFISGLIPRLIKFFGHSGKFRKGYVRISTILRLLKMQVESASSGFVVFITAFLRYRPLATRRVFRSKRGKHVRK